MYDILTTQGGIVRVVRHETALLGTGVSQVILDYAHANRMNYAVIWWIRAEQWAVMATDYARLAEAVELPERYSTDLNKVTYAVREWLKTHDNWLLIFDGAKVWNRLTPLLPEDPRGHVIVSSNLTTRPGKSQSVFVGRLWRRESIEYLMRRTLETDERAVAALASRTADTPLALHLVASHITATGMSVGKFQELYDEHRESLSNEYPELSVWQVCYSALLLMALDKLAHEAPAGLQLLCLLGYLSNSGMRRTLLRDSVAQLAKRERRVLESEEGFRKTLDALSRFGLVTLDKEFVHTQEHIQSIVRHWLEEPVDNKRSARTPATLLKPSRRARKQNSEWAKRVVTFLYNAVHLTDEAESAAVWRDLLPHITKSLSHCDRLELKSTEATGLWIELARYLSDRRLNTIAEAAYERAARRLANADRRDRPLLDEVQERRAELLIKLGRAQQAAQCYTELIERSNASKPVEDTKIVQFYTGLGDAELLARNPEKAEQAFERAFELSTSQSQSSDEIVAELSLRLGRAATQNQQFDAANEHFLRALDRSIRMHGETGAPVSRVVRALGDFYLKKGDLAKAAESFEWGLRCESEDSERAQRRKSICHQGMGTAFTKMGAHERARAHFEQALAIDLDNSGLPSVELVRDYYNLGRCLKKLGEAEEAKRLFDLAKHASSESPGPRSDWPTRKAPVSIARDEDDGPPTFEDS